jgi:hypothetical protein
MNSTIHSGSKEEARTLTVGISDARLLIFSIAQALPVLTRDSEDCEDLHDLVIAAAGRNAGILIVCFVRPRMLSSALRGE